MSQVSTVLWDIGGVLLTNGWDHVQRDKVLAHFGLPRDPFEQIHAELNDAWEKDKISIDEYLHKTVFYELRPFTVDDFIEQMHAQSLIIENTALGILEQVAASSDLVVAVLSNESRALNAYRFEKFGLHQYFDCFFSSCYLGLRKPHPEIYCAALDILQRGPSDVVFIDDRTENIATAKSLGMHGIVHKTATQTAEELGLLGIAVTP